MDRSTFIGTSLIAALSLPAVMLTSVGGVNAKPPQTGGSGKVGGSGEIGSSRGSRESREPRERVIGGPCQGCELVFEGRPDKLTATARIAEPALSGERLTVTGTVRRADGAPAPGIIVYAYQTDRTGVYPPSTTQHGALRAWVQTDAQGQYRLQTIRPGAYPKRDVPQHIHMHIIEPGRGTYYIGNILFDDDPLLTANHRADQAEARGGPGLVTPKRDDAGGWRVTRDIILGRNIPGYDDDR